MTQAIDARFRAFAVLVLRNRYAPEQPRRHGPAVRILPGKPASKTAEERRTRRFKLPRRGARILNPQGMLPRRNSNKRLLCCFRLQPLRVVVRNQRVDDRLNAAFHD